MFPLFTFQMYDGLGYTCELLLIAVVWAVYMHTLEGFVLITTQFYRGVIFGRWIGATAGGYTVCAPSERTTDQSEEQVCHAVDQNVGGGRTQSVRKGGKGAGCVNCCR